MMEYFRYFLILLRKQDNREDLKPSFSSIVWATIAVSTVLSLTVDRFLPFNFIFNMLRGVIANILGFSVFAIVYLLIVKTRKKRLSKDKYYIPVRKRLSYRQRTNLSVLLGSVVLLFILLSGKPGAIYTIKGALSISVLVLLLAFSRKGRDEFIKKAYELPDIKDMDSDRNMRNKIEENKREKEEENKSNSRKRGKTKKD